MYIFFVKCLVLGQYIGILLFLEVVKSEFTIYID